MERIRVVELFAGVGGFRLGLEACSSRFETIWANQWEPGKKVQHAYDCYVRQFGAAANCVNENIEIVKDDVPEHDLLVGGFPCQDYSVARTGAKGIEGKKGVLWWSIRHILDTRRPKYVLLENVDRLLKSPASQRGRDFGVMLRSFYDAGYAVEWRVINAAEYGAPQRRRRVFIFACRQDTAQYKALARLYGQDAGGLLQWMQQDGFFAQAFPVENRRNEKKSTAASLDEKAYTGLADVSDNFAASLYNSGVMIGGAVYSEELVPVAVEPQTLGSVLEEGPVDEKYFLHGSLEKWEYLKGAKAVPRIRPNGEPYEFREGTICFPDYLDKPSRTMLTSESTTNRSTHVVCDRITGEKRRLTPVECERLNGFPDNWTDTGMPERMRYFVMGNALVVPMITRMGQQILELEC